jgi:hypothetical protein
MTQPEGSEMSLDDAIFLFEQDRREMYARHAAFERACYWAAACVVVAPILIGFVLVMTS